MAKKLSLITPGEVLLEEFTAPLGARKNRLAKYFGTSAELWLGLQAEYDLRVTRRERGSEIDRRVRPMEAASTVPGSG